jgi:quercetin dioxygenase-like cupin family protein
MATQTKLMVRSFQEPDDQMVLEKAVVDLVDLDTRVGRITLQPGWRWSLHGRREGDPQRCQRMHKQYVVSGRLRVEFDDGTREELTAGQVALVPPGHDAVVLGDEPCVLVDFEGFAQR